MKTRILHWASQRGYACDYAVRLASDGVVALLAKLASAGLGYFSFLVLARLLPARDYGIFAVGFNLAIVASTVAGFGVTTALLRFSPEYEARRRPDLGKGIVVFAVGVTLAASLLAVVIFGAVAYGLTWAGTTGDFSHLPFIGLLAAIFAVSELVSSVLRARGSVGWALLPRDVAWRILLVAGAGIAMLAGATLHAAGVLLLAAGSLALVVAVQAVHAVRSLGPVLAGTGASFATRRWLAAVLPMWGSAVLFALVMQFDVVVVGMLLSPEEGGSYFAAIRTASLLGLLSIAGNVVGAPIVSRAFHDGDRISLERFCRIAALVMGLPAILGFAFLLLAGRWMLAIFDPGFVDAYPALVILAGGFAFSAACGPTGYFQQMIGQEKAYFRSLLASYSIVLPAQLCLAQVFGLAGVAAPTAFGMIAWNVLAISRLRRDHALDCSLLGLLRWPKRHTDAWRTA